MGKRSTTECQLSGVDPHDAGYTKEGAALPGVIVTATVDPTNKVNSINFRMDKTTRAHLTVGTPNPNTGQVTITVTGSTPTPVSAGNPTLAQPDANLIAYPGSLTTVQLAKTPVLVVIPKSVATPHDTAHTRTSFDANGYTSVSPENIATDLQSSPFLTDVPAGKKRLVTWWIVPVSIGVLDQFKQPLNSIYNGLAVNEYLRGNLPNGSYGFDWFDTHLDVTDGAYEDPVAVPRLGQEVLSGSTAASQWPSQPPLSMLPAGNGDVSASVKIGGHLLNPGVSNRRIYWKPTDGVQIVWPNPP